ncbi:zinc finger A20 and AN1 domain-containing stress-associated protein 8-like [Tripterygium wilfordii]|uniref:Zinc finger A20 and AN1 domain-containing stress-associated protein 8-like n=1 Tax=Tripterygium wilfordii TaxID=458696 RepID=A0A7J7E1Z7_TRIWF|nr:zinc finger A20 and AN1 domain-containing stress-associated protein 8-like [Tripterygium wilfordii]
MSMSRARPSPYSPHWNCCLHLSTQMQRMEKRVQNGGAPLVGNALVWWGGDVFGAVHRYSDKHGCSYDYLSAASWRAIAIANANPVFMTKKLDKI